MNEPSSSNPAVAHRWVSLAAICTAAGMVWLAFGDLGVAIPQIANEFSGNLSSLQWANNAFSLVTGALVIAAGKFGDLFGRRRMLEVGIVLLAAFSVPAALAPDIGWLVLGRGLMGIGAALILPASLALIPPAFSGKAETTAFGIWQAVAWGGLSVGPALSGLISDGLGWHWLFWINLPLAAVTLVVVRATTPESRDEKAGRTIDWLGLTSIVFAVFALLYALTEGPSVGWGSPLIVALFIATVVLSVVWWLIERHAREPLVNLDLFKIRAYNGALAANLTMNFTFAGLSFLLVLWLENARGYSAVEAGVLMLPATVGVFLCIPLGGRLENRRGGRLPSVVGLVVASAGLGLLGSLGTRSSTEYLAVALIIIGLGLGLVSTPVANTAVGEVPIDLAGTAAGVFKMSSMLGGALGVAALTAIARELTTKDAASVVEASGLTPADISQVRQALVNSSSFRDAIASLPHDLQSTVVKAATSAFSSGVADTMAVTAVLTFVATVAVFFLWPRRGKADRTAAGPGPDDQPAPSSAL
ncbi:MFS transporter [Streptomyces sp. NEAU-S7GS2]|uniref:MFS transporter n=1 Tax=Streptomyces sp. NEAU-S7GS2 TaxID=2202000 RepID=UPI000D7009AB|nr:MFS transporter [Streptomyces sp. NEAU-S7GS2]AWN30581.1 MFS transporter [Streptomyces sp. NEAU-S7GS2]